MTREEATKRFKAWAQQTIGNNCSDEDVQMFENILALLEQEPCENAISRETVLNTIKKVCFSKEQRWVDFRVSQGSNGQRDFIIKFIESLPPVTPKQKANCNMCKYYRGAHGCMGHAPCSYHRISGVFWNWYCSQFEPYKESEDK